MPTIQLRLRSQHAQVFRCEKRFVVLVAGRRSGKTTLALWWLIHHAASKDNQICYYVAPTRRQAKLIAWRKLKQLVGPDLVRATREDELELELKNSSILQLHGTSHADSLRGTVAATPGAEVWSILTRAASPGRLMRRWGRMTSP